MVSCYSIPDSVSTYTWRNCVRAIAISPLLLLACSFPIILSVTLSGVIIDQELIIRLISSLSVLFPICVYSILKNEGLTVFCVCSEISFAYHLYLELLRRLATTYIARIPFIENIIVFSLIPEIFKFSPLFRVIWAETPNHAIFITSLCAACTFGALSNNCVGLIDFNDLYLKTVSELVFSVMGCLWFLFQRISIFTLLLSFSTTFGLRFLYNLCESFLVKSVTILAYILIIAGVYIYFVYSSTNIPTDEPDIESVSDISRTAMRNIRLDFLEIKYDDSLVPTTGSEYSPCSLMSNI